ncbi:MAG TPA: GNAT family N-acetyltransferase [Candidatus Acidoferrum sp.]|nr:GNAT family N-acetyltransferase [Candidatus Acidoferrum sp.]
MIADTKKIFLKTWQGYAVGFPSSARLEHAEMEIAFAGISVPLFNLAFPKDSGKLRREELERLLGEFGKLLTPRGVPGLLMVRGGQVENGAGLEPMLRMPGMVAAELLSPKRELGVFDIREVSGAVMAEEIARLNVVAYEMEMKDVAALTCAELWRAPHHGFLLYEDGKAVAGGAASFVESVSYIGWMATLPEKRGRGYAEALLRHADAFLRHRYSVKETVLHATEMGRPVYARMGFQAVDEFAGYLCVPGNKTGEAGVG